jgi:hypothetical protein
MNKNGKAAGQRSHGRPAEGANYPSLSARPAGPSSRVGSLSMSHFKSSTSQTPTRDYTREAAACVEGLKLRYEHATVTWGSGPLPSDFAEPFRIYLEGTIKELRAREGCAEGTQGETIREVLQLAKAIRKQLQGRHLGGSRAGTRLVQMAVELQKQRDRQEDTFRRLLGTHCTDADKLRQWCEEARAWLTRYMEDRGWTESDRDPFQCARIAAKGWELSKRLCPPDVSKLLDPPDYGGVFRCGDVLQGLREIGRLCEANRGRAEEAGAGRASDSSGEDLNWFTVTQAATTACCNTGQITRAVDAGLLKSNGKAGRERRIDLADLARWILRRAGRGETTESDAAVERKVERGGSK